MLSASAIAILVGVGVVAAASRFAGASIDTDVSHGCQWTTSHERGIVMAVPWIMRFLFDTMIFLLTVNKTLETRSEGTTSLSGIIEVMFRDGAIYYAAMACAIAINVITYFALQVRSLQLSSFQFQ